MRALFVLVIFVIATIGVVDVVCPQHSRGGNIVGVVVGRSNRPIPRAFVTLNTSIAYTYTDYFGNFAFQDVRPGGYIVRATKPGCGTASVRVIVNPGSTVRVRIRLPGC